MRLRFGLALHDPLSGFFALRGALVEQVRERLRPVGFKILLEILRAAPGASAVEVPIRFHPRRSGHRMLRGSVVLAGIRQWLRGSDGHLQ